MIYANLSAWITVKKYYLGKVRRAVVSSRITNLIPFKKGNTDEKICDLDIVWSSSTAHRFAWALRLLRFLFP